MNLRRLIPALALSMALAACGPHLGDYEVVDLTVVDGESENEFSTRPSKPYLQVTARSDFDLTKGGDKYVYKVECGFRGERGWPLYGPAVNEDPPREVFEYYDGGKPERAADGRIEYLLFLPLDAPMQAPKREYDQYYPAYDLRTDPEDLCIIIMQTGYYITDSESEKIRIPAAEVKAAIAGP